MRNRARTLTFLAALAAMLSTSAVRAMDPADWLAQIARLAEGQAFEEYSCDHPSPLDATLDTVAVDEWSFARALSRLALDRVEQLEAEVDRLRDRLASRDEDDPEISEPAALGPAAFLGVRHRDAGAEILEVYPGTPAEAAGLEAGDRILRFAGEEVHSERLHERIANAEVGSTVDLRVYRAGSEFDLSLALMDLESFLEFETALDPFEVASDFEADFEADFEESPDEVAEVAAGLAASGAEEPIGSDFAPLYSTAGCQDLGAPHATAPEAVAEVLATAESDPVGPQDDPFAFDDDDYAIFGEDVLPLSAGADEGSLESGLFDFDPNAAEDTELPPEESTPPGTILEHHTSEASFRQASPPVSPWQEPRPFGIYYADSVDGVRVVCIDEGSLGSHVGLAPGDVLRAIDGERCGTASELSVLLETRDLEDPMALSYERGGEEATVHTFATLGVQPPDDLARLD